MFPKTTLHPVKNSVRWGVEVGEGRQWMERLGWEESGGKEAEGPGRVVIARRVKVVGGEQRR